MAEYIGDVWESRCGCRDGKGKDIRVCGWREGGGREMVDLGDRVEG